MLFLSVLAIEEIDMWAVLFCKQLLWTVRAWDHTRKGGVLINNVVEKISKKLTTILEIMTAVPSKQSSLQQRIVLRRW